MPNSRAMSGAPNERPRRASSIAAASRIPLTSWGVRIRAARSIRWSAGARTPEHGFAPGSSMPSRSATRRATRSATRALRACSGVRSAAMPSTQPLNVPARQRPDRHAADRGHDQGAELLLVLAHDRRLVRRARLRPDGPADHPAGERSGGIGDRGHPPRRWGRRRRQDPAIDDPLQRLRPPGEGRRERRERPADHHAALANPRPVGRTARPGAAPQCPNASPISPPSPRRITIPSRTTL